jgi:hypothetical protein
MLAGRLNSSRPVSPGVEAIREGVKSLFDTRGGKAAARGRTKGGNSIVGTDVTSGKSVRGIKFVTRREADIFVGARTYGNIVCERMAEAL